MVVLAAVERVVVAFVRLVEEVLMIVVMVDSVEGGAGAMVEFVLRIRQRWDRSSQKSSSQYGGSFLAMVVAVVVAGADVASGWSSLHTVACSVVQAGRIMVFIGLATTGTMGSAVCISNRQPLHSTDVVSVKVITYLVLTIPL